MSTDVLSKFHLTLWEGEKVLQIYAMIIDSNEKSIQIHVMIIDSNNNKTRQEGNKYAVSCNITQISILSLVSLLVAKFSSKLVLYQIDCKYSAEIVRYTYTHRNCPSIAHHNRHLAIASPHLAIHILRSPPI